MSMIDVVNLSFSYEGSFESGKINLYPDSGDDRKRYFKGCDSGGGAGAKYE